MIKKFGVSPASIPDYLALVGDCGRRLSGTAGLGREVVGCRAGQVCPSRIDSCRTGREWRVNAANASALAHTLSRERERALLFRTLATLRTDIALFEDVDQLRWNGPTPAFAALAARLDAAVTETKRPEARRPSRTTAP